MAQRPQPAAEGMIDALTQEEMSALSAGARVQAFPKNRVIINEGDQSESIFIIAAGRVKVFLQGDDGKEVVLNVHGPGEYFGEMVLDGGSRSASVMALEPSRLAVVPQARFREFLYSHPAFSVELLENLIRRTRALTENVKSLALMDVYGRVARLLLELARDDGGKLVVNEKLTQQDIANRVGASREMIGKIMKDLADGGYISVERKRITVHKVLPRHW
jgi:CRP/FNR family cyclic AMP-dependent transcriptional regulator